MKDGFEGGRPFTEDDPIVMSVLSERGRQCLYGASIKKVRFR